MDTDARHRSLLLLAVVVVSVAATLTACVPAERITVFGDSLTVQAAGNLGAAHVHAAGGTAPCDWQASFRRLLDADRPQAVVFAFIGNRGTACMAGVTTAAQLAAKYRTALADMAGYAIQRHVAVRFVVPPPMAPDRGPAWNLAGDPAIGAMECRLAATAPVQARCDFGARDTLAVNGGYAASIGGLPVRALDGVHLAAPEGTRRYGAALLTAAQR